MYGCPLCKKENEVLNSRINHLESAKYDYERQKGKGSFAKRNKKANDLLTKLVEQKVDLAVRHVDHISESDDNPTEACTPRVG